jgi:hypothetical protein
MPPFPGYTGDFNWSNYTPLDSTGKNYDLFRSAYKNIRFSAQPITQYRLTAVDLANLPGLSYKFYGDTSFWRGLMAYNGISDPLSEVAVGIIINVPSRSDIVAYLSKQAANKSGTLTI